MPIQEFNSKIDRLISLLPSWAKTNAEDIALNDLAALISERVINTGKDETNSSFSDYSEKPTLAGASTFTSKKAFNKVAGSKKKRRGLQWVTVNGNSLFVLDGGYKEVRDLEGRETEHKSFERTGEMWRNFGIVRSFRSGGDYVVKLGGLNKDSQEKMNWNSDREGVNILGATKEEDNIVTEITKERLIKLITDTLR